MDGARSLSIQRTKLLGLLFVAFVGRFGFIGRCFLGLISFRSSFIRRLGNGLCPGCGLCLNRLLYNLFRAGGGLGNLFLSSFYGLLNMGSSLGYFFRNFLFHLKNCLNNFLFGGFNTLFYLRGSFSNFCRGSFNIFFYFGNGFPDNLGHLFFSNLNGSLGYFCLGGFLHFDSSLSNVFSGGFDSFFYFGSGFLANLGHLFFSNLNGVSRLCSGFVGNGLVGGSGGGRSGVC